MVLGLPFAHIPSRFAEDGCRAVELWRIPLLLPAASLALFFRYSELMQAYSRLTGAKKESGAQAIARRDKSVEKAAGQPEGPPSRSWFPESNRDTAARDFRTSES
jgi:hypothetical protein